MQPQIFLQKVVMDNHSLVLPIRHLLEYLTTWFPMVRHKDMLYT